MPVIDRLRGFHTLKSFLGCVGYIMAESGLEDLMRLVYPVDVTHIMDGESYYTALRVHFFIDSALCCYFLGTLSLYHRGGSCRYGVLHCQV